jgi:IMP cyclohydrolase
MTEDIMYVGRIVTVGMAGAPFGAYRVSSRSFPNRVARITDATVAIVPIDPEEVKKNPYIAYNALKEGTRGVVVTNGSHTDPIFERFEGGMAPEEALRVTLDEMGYEKDQLNTPRIAGIVTADKGYLGIVRDDGVEVQGFDLKPYTCRVICTYELNHLTDKEYKFEAGTALDCARFVVDGEFFNTLELPVCAAAYMADEIAVYNPHEKA